MEALHAELLQLRPLAKLASAKKGRKDESNTGLSRLLCCFLPNMVVDHVNRGEFEMTPHYSLHPSSVLLFVDICGYTALAQALGSEGNQGTEKLSQSLDAFFNRAITSIYKAGGDVIKFCGDALLCVFESSTASGNSPRNPSIAACAACIEMQHQLRNFKAADGVVLDLKLMLGQGTVVGNYVCSQTFEHAEYLISGAPMRQIMEIDKTIMPGEIILSPEILAVVADVVKVKNSGPADAIRKVLLGVNSDQSQFGGAIAPQSNIIRFSDTDNDNLAPFLEAQILDQVREISYTWSRTSSYNDYTRNRLSRHDVCTTLFVNFSGSRFSSEDPQQALDLFQAVFQAIYNPCRQFQGTLRQFLQDDKGQVGILIFSGRESNTLAACRCALKIRETLLAMGINFGMGISTGKVFCGPVGDHSRCEMTWIGDSVNHAARLMVQGVKRINAILADKASVDAAASEILFDSIGALALKGKGMIQTFQVNGLKYRGSVLTEQQQETVDLSSPPQMFDNLASMHSAISLDWAVHNSTSKSVESGLKGMSLKTMGTKGSRGMVKSQPTSANFVDKEDKDQSLVLAQPGRTRATANTDISLADAPAPSAEPVPAAGQTEPDKPTMRYAICCTISVADSIDSDDMSLIRDTVVDFGGDISSINPFMNAAHNIFITVIFVVGALPSRQTGTMAHLTRKQTLLNFSSFLEHLCHDEHFSSDESPVKAVSAAAGPLAVSSKSLLSSLFISGEAAQESLEILTVSKDLRRVGENAIITITEDVLAMDDVSGGDGTMESIENSIRMRHEIAELKSTDHRRQGKGARIKKKLFNVVLGSHRALNPGMAMPVAFIRRFLNDKQLERCNEYLSSSCSPIISDFVERGVFVSNLTGVFSATSLIFMYIGLSGDTHTTGESSRTTRRGSVVSSATGGGRRTTRAKKTPTPFLIFKLARKAMEICEKELKKVHCDFLSASTVHTTLQLSFAARCAPEVATYLACRVNNAMSKAKVCDTFRCFVRHGEIPWRTGANGGVFPYGHIVRSIAHNMHATLNDTKFTGVFLQTDGVNADPSSSYRMLVNIKDTNFPVNRRLNLNSHKSMKAPVVPVEDEEDEDEADSPEEEKKKEGGEEKEKDASGAADDINTDSDDDYDSDKDLEDSPSTRARKLADTLSASPAVQSAAANNRKSRSGGRRGAVKNLMTVSDYKKEDANSLLRKQSVDDHGFNSVTRAHGHTDTAAVANKGALEAFGNIDIASDSTGANRGLVDDISENVLPGQVGVDSDALSGSKTSFDIPTPAKGRRSSNVFASPPTGILLSTKHDPLDPERESNGSFSGHKKRWVQCTDKLTPACRKVHSDSIVVGREGIQDILFQQAEALLISNATTITILEAKGGYGKSAIADSIMQLAKALKLTHVRVQSDEASMHDPWAPWKPIIGFLCTAAGMSAIDGIDPILDLLDVDSCERRRAGMWLEDILPSIWINKGFKSRNVSLASLSSEQSAGSNGPMMGVSQDLPRPKFEAFEAEEIEEIEEEEANMQASGMLSMKLELFDMLVRGLFAKVGSLVLVIEDLHWMDTSSWKLMRRICTISSGVMIVCTNRPVSKSQASDLAFVIANGHRCRKEVLKRLDAQDLLKMATNAFPTKQISNDFHERLVTVSRGFAFLASELLRQSKDDPSASILFRGIKELKNIMDSSLVYMGPSSPQSQGGTPRRNRNLLKKGSVMRGLLNSVSGAKPPPGEAPKIAFKLPTLRKGKKKKPDKMSVKHLISVFAGGKKAVGQAVRETSVFLGAKKRMSVDHHTRKNSLIELADKVSIGPTTSGLFEDAAFLDDNNKESHLDEWLAELRKEEYLSRDGEHDLSRELIHQHVMGATRSIEVAEDPYTQEESSMCDQFYSLIKTSEAGANVGWDRVSSLGGVDYYVTDDVSGYFKQSKSTTTSENCSPIECLGYIMGTLHMRTKYRIHMVSGSNVVTLNDHTHITKIDMRFPPPCYNRELVLSCTWKFLKKKSGRGDADSKASIIFVMQSVDHPSVPKVKNVARSTVKYAVYLLEPLESGLGTRITFMLSINPNGVISRSFIEGVLVDMSGGPAEIKEFFSHKDDAGLPLLQRLLQKRISVLSKTKRLLLGYAAVMGGAIEKAEDLILALETQNQRTQKGARSVVSLDSSFVYKELVELVKMGLLEGEIFDADDDSRTANMLTSMTPRHHTVAVNEGMTEQTMDLVTRSLDKGQEVKGAQMGTFTIRFKHKFVSECALRMLPREHFSMANSIAASLINKRIKVKKATGDARGDTHYHELARLYKNCGQLEQARLNFILAGSAAMRQGATKEASRMFFELIELSRLLDPNRKPLQGFHSLRHESAHCHYMLGLTLDSPVCKLLCFNEASLLLGSHEIPGTLEIKLSLYSTMLKWRVMPPDKRAKRAIVTSQKAVESNLKAKISQQQALLFKNNLEIFHYCNVMQVHFGSKSGLSDELLVGFAEISVCLTAQGNFKDSETYLAMIEPIVDVVDSPLSRACYLHARASLMCVTGNVIDSLRLYEECTALYYTVCGEFQRWYHATCEHCIALIQLGRLRVAKDICGACQDKCQYISEDGLVQKFAQLKLIILTRMGMFKKSIEEYSSLTEQGLDVKDHNSDIITNAELLLTGESTIALKADKIFTQRHTLSDQAGVAYTSAVLSAEQEGLSLGATAVAFCMQLEDGQEAKSSVLKILSSSLKGLKAPGNFVSWAHYETAYWGVSASTELYVRTLQEQTDDTANVITDQMMRNMRDWVDYLSTFDKFPVCAPWIKLCRARHRVLESMGKDVDGALQQLESASNKATKIGAVLAGAIIDVESAVVGRSMSMQMRASKCKQAIAKFEEMDASYELEQAVLTLVRLDPHSTEFRKLVEKVDSSGRRSNLSENTLSMKSGSVTKLDINFADVHNASEAPLVGRKDEFTLIMKAANGFRSMGDALVPPILIEGTAGMGKTALLKSVQMDLQKTMSNFFKIIRSETSDLEQNNPFYVWKRVFGELFMLNADNHNNEHYTFSLEERGNHNIPHHNKSELAAERADRESTLSQLIEWTGREETEMYHPLLNSVLPWNFKETDQTKELKGEMRSARTIEYLRAVLEGYAMQHKKLVFMFENIHWIDTASFELLLSCCDSTSIWFMLTSRSGVFGNVVENDEEEEEEHEEEQQEQPEQASSQDDGGASGRRSKDKSLVGSLPKAEVSGLISQTKSSMFKNLDAWSLVAAGSKSFKKTLGSGNVKPVEGIPASSSLLKKMKESGKARVMQNQEDPTNDVMAVNVGNSLTVMASAAISGKSGKAARNADKRSHRSFSSERGGERSERSHHAPPTPRSEVRKSLTGEIGKTKSSESTVQGAPDESAYSSGRSVASSSRIGASSRDETDLVEDDHERNLFWTLINEKCAICLVLGVIDRAALHEHICHLLDCASVSDELLNVVDRRAGGNLLYVHEFIGSMSDAGLLVRNGTKMTIESEDTLAVPERIEALISSRVDALQPSQQYLLRTAAAIGRQFMLSMLVHVHPNTDMLRTLERDIKELVRRRFLEFVGDSHDQLQFCHTYVQEAVYNSALVDTQKQIHRSCAQYFEIYFVEDLGPHFGSIAHHYFSAEEWQQAAHYSSLAATFALEQNMYESTIGLVETSLMLIDQLGKRYVPSNRFKNREKEQAHLHFQVATARFAAGNFGKSIFHYEKCIKLHGYHVINEYPWVRIEELSNKFILSAVAFQGVPHSLVTDQLAATDALMESNSIVSEAFLNLGTLYHLQGGSNMSSKHTSCLMKAAMFARKDGVATRALLKVLCGVVNIGMSQRWTRIVDYCLHESARLSAELDSTDCVGMNNCVVALKMAYHGDLSNCITKFGAGKQMCWESSQLDWWSMALICEAWAMFEVGKGWDAIGVFKYHLSDALSTRNFFVFERICTFLLPYLWELDTELSTSGQLVEGGDCYEEWSDYFSEQSAVMSNNTTSDKSRKAFRYHLDQYGTVVSSAGVLRLLRLNEYELAGMQALELAKSYHWPQDSVECLLMSLPTYQLVLSLTRLHAKQKLKVKDAVTACLDKWEKGYFLKFAEAVCKAFESSIYAEVSKPWACLCRALVLRVEDRLGKSIEKLETALKIASHHNMQSCLGYVYLSLANAEKQLRDAEEAGLGDGGGIMASVSVTRFSEQRSQLQDEASSSPGGEATEVRGADAPGSTVSGDQKLGGGVDGPRPSKKTDKLFNFIGLMGGGGGNIHDRGERALYVGHAKAACEISEQCGLVFVFYEANQVLHGHSALSPAGEHRDLSSSVPLSRASMRRWSGAINTDSAPTGAVTGDQSQMMSYDPSRVGSVAGSVRGSMRRRSEQSVPRGSGGDDDDLSPVMQPRLSGHDLLLPSPKFFGPGAADSVKKGSVAVAFSPVPGAGGGDESGDASASTSKRGSRRGSGLGIRGPLDTPGSAERSVRRGSGIGMGGGSSEAVRRLSSSVLAAESPGRGLGLGMVHSSNAEDVDAHGRNIMPPPKSEQKRNSIFSNGVDDAMDFQKLLNQQLHMVQGTLTHEQSDGGMHHAPNAVEDRRNRMFIPDGVEDIGDSPRRGSLMMRGASAKGGRAMGLLERGASQRGRGIGLGAPDLRTHADGMKPLVEDKRLSDPRGSQINAMLSRGQPEIDGEDGVGEGLVGERRISIESLGSGVRMPQSPGDDIRASLMKRQASNKSVRGFGLARGASVKGPGMRGKLATQKSVRQQMMDRHAAKQSEAMNERDRKLNGLE
ncbi:hypothetical protein TeGR_g9956 [Tetraparma gracilis]|nr:hypothetical protein TeGR_g9956 [Tetraparma gracilis]